MSLDIDMIRADTPGTRTVNHMLACGSSLMPRQVLNAVTEFLVIESEMGGYEAAAAHSETLTAVYDSIGRFLNAAPDEIAIVENATVAWTQAFYSIAFEPGDRVITCEAEYGANYVAYLHRAKRDGLVVEVVPNTASGQVDVEALDAMIDDRVKLISMTWIPTNGGLVNPAAEIGRVAKKHGVLYLLDACQAVGQMPIDVAELQCDFLSGTGRKFLRAPRGTGFLYVARSVLPSLDPVVIDHYSADWVTVDTYRLKPDAKRFENWENAYALRAGLGVAVDYALDLGLEAIQARAWGLAAQLRSAIEALPGAEVRDLGDAPCAIVSFTIAGLHAPDVVPELRADGICIGTSNPESTLVDATARSLPDLFRAAPHYFNTEDELDQLVSALRAKT
jgi:cysteine desulfurase/selenocysteine lyase